MKILITGGAGFIGTNLALALSETNSVISIDNYSTGLMTNHISGVNYLFGDTRIKSDFDRLPTDISVVYHLAAKTRIQPSFDNPVEYVDTNIVGTQLVCQFCMENNVPMIYAGSSSHHSGKFKNVYTFSKDVGEEVIQLYQEIFGLKASIARFYNVYGPYQIKGGPNSTLIGNWEDRIEKGLPLIIYGDGTKRRDFTHVNDIVDGLIAINEKNAWGNIFELGRGENHSIKEIADMFGHEIIYYPDKIGEADNTLCNNTLANKILQWSPKNDINNYIKNYLKK